MGVSCPKCPEESSHISGEMSVRLRDAAAATNGQKAMASGPQRDSPD
jgi:hypothetical protein